MPTLREIRQAALQRFLRATFRLWEALGVHVTPVHYFQPIPDSSRLPERLWREQSSLVGIDLRTEAQLALLAEMASGFRAEYAAFPRAPTGDPRVYHHGNVAFESPDAEVLHALVRLRRPRRVVEVGSGWSTRVIAGAALRNAAEGHPCTFTAIEPYPAPVLRAGLPGLDRLVRAGVEGVPLEEFTGLESGDVLFIDSTHVLRIGGDVQREILEIVPRLRPGVAVHFHDVFLPAEYPRPWVMELRRFWTEQYLLQAFLAFNQAFQVIWAGSHLHLSHPERLEAAFPAYRRDRNLPGSFWIERVR